MKKTTLTKRDMFTDSAYFHALFDKLYEYPRWMDAANCLDVEDVSDIFSAAKLSRLCKSCPVVEECRASAEKFDAQAGVFGGRDFS